MLFGYFILPIIVKIINIKRFVTTMEEPAGIDNTHDADMPITTPSMAKIAEQITTFL